MASLHLARVAGQLEPPSSPRASAPLSMPGGGRSTAPASRPAVPPVPGIPPLPPVPPASTPPLPPVLPASNPPEPRASMLVPPAPAASRPPPPPAPPPPIPPVPVAPPAELPPVPVVPPALASGGPERPPVANPPEPPAPPPVPAVASGPPSGVRAPPLPAMAPSNLPVDVDPSHATTAPPTHRTPRIALALHRARIMNIVLLPWAPMAAPVYRNPSPMSPDWRTAVALCCQSRRPGSESASALSMARARPVAVKAGLHDQVGGLRRVPVFGLDRGRVARDARNV